MTLANTTKKENLYFKQLSTPYFSALKKYIEDNILTFHCPGHQQGKGTIDFFNNFIKENSLACDITQILGMDDLHQPQSIIKEAQELAALVL
ncbi:MAG: hypothetical protein HYU63_05925 [Armatimonadetes bacterium]|nr:hypothetical protein [Armatimonadota bacterium]